MVTTNTKTCAYQSCHRKVSGINYLCSEHYAAKQTGAIDKCPECGSFKETKFPLCFDCRRKLEKPAQRKASLENSLSDEPIRKRNYPKAWSKRDETASRFFAYILKLDGGEFYAGHTRDLRERISEHQDDCTKSIAGRNPRLQYFEILPSRDAAEKRETELKRL